MFLCIVLVEEFHYNRELPVFNVVSLYQRRNLDAVGPTGSRQSRFQGKRRPVQKEDLVSYNQDGKTGYLIIGQFGSDFVTRRSQIKKDHP